MNYRFSSSIVNREVPSKNSSFGVSALRVGEWKGVATGDVLSFGWRKEGCSGVPTKEDSVVEGGERSGVKEDAEDEVDSVT